MGEIIGWAVVLEPSPSRRKKGIAPTDDDYNFWSVQLLKEELSDERAGVH